MSIPRQMPPPTHKYAGSNSERQSVGDPGHCEPCAVQGHLVAHPDLGCGDVGCYRDHPEEDEHNGCSECGRTDVGLKKDGTLRMHVHAHLKGQSFLVPSGNRCRGAGKPPKSQP